MAKKAAKKAKTPPKSSGTPAENSVDSPRLPAVEIVPIESLEFDPRNARKHDARDLAVTGASLDRFGQVEPLIVWRNVVIAGNGRLQHMRAKGTTHAEIRRMDHLTEAEARELAVRLNRSGTLAGWNEEILLETLREIESAGVDLCAAMAYTADEIEALTTAVLHSASDSSDVQLHSEKFTEPRAEDPRTAKIIEDNVPELPSKAESRHGDLWILGQHRLLCGDSTDPNAVARVMRGFKARVMNTDPPYGVSYDAQNVADSSNAHDGGRRKSKWKPIESDDKTNHELQSFLECTIRAALPFLDSDCAFYLWHPMLTQGTFFAAAAAADILIHRQIIWVKPNFIFGRGDYHWRHELCFYGWIKGSRPKWYGSRNQDTVWNFAIAEKKQHPTQKPVSLFATPLLNHTVPGDRCFEPFAGSGSQLIAAEQTERVCHAIEIDPAYCDVVKARWEALTGKKADRVRA